MRLYSQFLIPSLLICCVGCDATFRNVGNGPSSLPAPQNTPINPVEQTGDVPWGGLTVEMAGVPLEQAKRIIIFLHGYGAQGDDLVGLGNEIDAGDGVAFIFPAAPLTLQSGGLAWTQFNGDGFQQSHQKLLSFMKYLNKKYPDRSVIVGGFSQGAMMASNLLSEESLQLDGMLIYSPYFSLARPLHTGKPLPKIFLSHGRSDTVLPLSESEKLRDTLKSKGYEVTWFPFEGGHTIPSSVIRASKNFLSQLEIESPSS